jgi:hypothetical protein
MLIPQTPGSTWLNDHPLSRIDEVLGILSTETETGEPARLVQVALDDRSFWEIAIPCAKGATCHLQVEEKVVHALRMMDALIPFRYAYWGWSTADDTCLVVTEEARHASRKDQQRHFNHALTLLIAEVGEEQARAAARRSFGRTQYRFGPLYVDFTLESGKKYRILPEQNEIIVP